MPKRTPGIVGTNIIRLLKERGLGDSALAKRSGLSRSTITSIMRGDAREPAFDTILKIADGFGVHFTQLTRLPLAREVLDSAIEEFRRSSWAEMLEPPLTEADLDYLRGEGALSFEGRAEGPRPKTLYLAVQLGRDLAKGPPSK